eukprot:6181924-Pleurochrysis_carterae.AAC.2
MSTALFLHLTAARSSVSVKYLLCIYMPCRSLTRLESRLILWFVRLLRRRRPGTAAHYRARHTLADLCVMTAVLQPHF